MTSTPTQPDLSADQDLEEADAYLEALEREEARAEYEADQDLE